MSIKGNENHILVGLGGTGGKVLKAFRKRFVSVCFRNILLKNAQSYLLAMYM